jgi:hypothetical protein
MFFAKGKADDKSADDTGRGGSEVISVGRNVGVRTLELCIDGSIHSRRRARSFSKLGDRRFYQTSLVHMLTRYHLFGERRSPKHTLKLRRRISSSHLVIIGRLIDSRLG